MDLTNYLNGTKIGQSMSLNGTCLSITKIINHKYCEFDLTNETISRTTFSYMKIGDQVNVERSLNIGSRLDGHFVFGHVDGTSVITKLVKTNSETKVWFTISKDLSKFIVSKGSITIDGVSLTLVDDLDDEFTVCIIPQTLTHTNFNTKKVGDKVNIEIDMLSKLIYKKSHQLNGTY